MAEAEKTPESAQLDEEALRKAIAETGYEVKSVESKPYEKHGLFHR